MALGSFGVLTVVGRRGDDRFALDDLRGLARRRPMLAFAFTVLLLSQAGVPLTSGFLAKFGVILAAADAGSWALAVIAMLAAVVAAFVYLRIIVSMYMTDAEDVAGDRIRVPVSAGLALALAVAFTVAAGFVPGWLVDTARDAVPFLVA
jgi:NADH-quinone oxidoreductase subunit N